MHNSMISGGYGGSALQDLLRLMQASQAAGAGQNVQAAGSSQSTEGADGAPAQAQAPSPAADAASQFATQTLASLLKYQQSSAWASNTASQLIGQLDSNGDGQLSLSEVEKALGATTNAQQSGLAQAFAQLDSNGDGQISQSELAAALQQQAQQSGGARHMQGHHHHEAATATQAAQDIIDSLDPSGGGSLSLAALESDLGLNGAASSSSASSTSGTGASSSTSGSGAATSSISTTTNSSPLATSLSQAFARLDANGDGQVSASELASAIQAFRQAQEALWSSPWRGGGAGVSAAV